MLSALEIIFKDEIEEKTVKICIFQHSKDSRFVSDISACVNQVKEKRTSRNLLTNYRFCWWFLEEDSWENMKKRRHQDSLLSAFVQVFPAEEDISLKQIWRSHLGQHQLLSV